MLKDTLSLVAISGGQNENFNLVTGRNQELKI